jgi:hypothetical protein
MTTPAVQAVAQLQRRRLSRSLDCAYVRPLAVDGRPRTPRSRTTPRSPRPLHRCESSSQAPGAHGCRVRDGARGRQGIRGGAPRELVCRRPRLSGRPRSAASSRRRGPAARPEGSAPGPGGPAQGGLAVRPESAATRSRPGLAGAGAPRRGRAGHDDRRRDRNKGPRPPQPRARRHFTVTTSHGSASATRSRGRLQSGHS